MNFYLHTMYGTLGLEPLDADCPKEYRTALYDLYDKINNTVKTNHKRKRPEQVIETSSQELNTFLAGFEVV